MIVLLDGMNFFHRCRAGFQLGDYNVVYNAFRNLRALVEQHDPMRIFLVLEGHPQQRIDILPEYKANRVIDQSDTKKVVEMDSFYRQVNVATEMIAKYFPISIVRHPRYEADDTIYNIIKRNSTVAKWRVISTDSDFIQLFDEFDNVELYNPTLKKLVEKPTYDYVIWKSLRGDGSDNIPQIPGVGDKTAEALANDLDELQKYLSADPDKAVIFNRNLSLIKFIDWDNSVLPEFESSSPCKDWSPVREEFQRMEFKSILKETYWERFVSTFDKLWGPAHSSDTII